MSTTTVYPFVPLDLATAIEARLEKKGMNRFDKSDSNMKELMT